MNKHFDLIVIGGGILGTFHAYHALLLGKSVLQLEKDNFPVGATVRNFGQVVPSGMEAGWFEYGVAGLEIYKSIQQEFDISVQQMVVCTLHQILTSRP
jgi:glycine/D-amino acid oxidase-like deaminating enzyme